MFAELINKLHLFFLLAQEDSCLSSVPVYMIFYGKPCLETFCGLSVTVI